jgi:hypothetical protein
MIEEGKDQDTKEQANAQTQANEPAVVEYTPEEKLLFEERKLFEGKNENIWA